MAGFDEKNVFQNRKVGHSIWKKILDGISQEDQPSTEVESRLTATSGTNAERQWESKTDGAQITRAGPRARNLRTRLSTKAGAGRPSLRYTVGANIRRGKTSRASS